MSDKKWLADKTRELVTHIRQTVRAPGFWKNAVRQEELRGKIFMFLSDDDIVDFDGLCPVTTMEGFVRDKRFWIYTKLAEKEALPKPAPQREYVSGEGMPYLGKGYRLLLVDDDAQDVPVKLKRGRFRMRRGDAAEGRTCMVRWYTEHAQPWLAKRVARFAGRVGVTPARVSVQDLGYRWGSCGKEGSLNFHWRVILLPPEVIEYVVVHELVHLHEPHHTPEFWRRLERVMPDFSARKKVLVEHGVATAGY